MAEWQVNDEGFVMRKLGGEVHVLHHVLDIGDKYTAAARCDPEQVYYDETVGFLYLLVEGVLKIFMCCGEDVTAIRNISGVSSFMVNRDDASSFIVRRFWKKHLEKAFLHINVVDESETFHVDLKAGSDATFKVFNNELLLITEAMKLGLWDKSTLEVKFTSFSREILFVEVVDDVRFLLSFTNCSEILILDRKFNVMTSIIVSFPSQPTHVVPIRLVDNQLFLMGGESLGKISILDDLDESMTLKASVIPPVAMGRFSASDSSIPSATARDQRLVFTLLDFEGEKQTISILLKPTIREFAATFDWNKNYLIVDGPPKRNSYNYLLFNGRHLCRVEATVNFTKFEPVWYTTRKTKNVKKWNTLSDLTDLSRHMADWRIFYYGAVRIPSLTEMVKALKEY